MADAQRKVALYRTRRTVREAGQQANGGPPPISPDFHLAAALDAQASPRARLLLRKLQERDRDRDGRVNFTQMRDAIASSVSNCWLCATRR